MQITARRMYYTTNGENDPNNASYQEYLTTATSGTPCAWIWGVGDINFTTNTNKDGWIASGTVQVRAIYRSVIYASSSQYFIANIYIYEGNTIIGSMSLNIQENLLLDSNSNPNEYTSSATYTFTNKEIKPNTRNINNLSVKLVIDFTKFVADTSLNGGYYPGHGTSGLGYDSIRAVVKRSESSLISASVEELPPLISPPVISNLINYYPHDGNNEVSASMDSIFLKWNSDGDPITESWYKVNDNAWVQLSAPVTDCVISNLSPGTPYTILVQCGNEAGYGNVLSITIRTRHEPPVVNLSLNSVDLETLTFNWSSNKDLASTQYKIDNGEWVNLGQTGLSGTFTTKWFDPKTTHTIYFKGVSTVTYDSLDSNEPTANGTTFDRAHIQSIGECIFGLNINLQLQSESEKLLKLQIWTEGNSKKPLFEFDNIRKGAFTFTPTQDQLDQMYKCFTNTNSIPISFLLTTHGDWKDWDDIESKESLQLTGIAKTAHIGIGDVPRRAQVWIGDENNKPRRAVAWQGVDNKPRRCI